MTTPRPGAHGGDGPAVARALGLDPSSIVDLSQSLNPFAPPVEAILGEHLDAVAEYPDPRDATAAMAAAIGVPVDHLVLTNGGSEAISLVARELGGRVAAEPDFALHPRGTGGPTWRSNPHSPSGHLAFAHEHADVWDEAFYPLATGEWTRGDTGSVVVGSLTKIFACPGLRLGYVLSVDAERLTRHQPEWSVNSLALAVLPHLLEAADLREWRDAIARQRVALVEVLARHGLVADAADAPWVLVASTALRDRLAPHGVVVRDCTSFGLPGVARIAVPNDRDLGRLDRALTISQPQEHP